MLGQTVTVVNKSGKVVSTSKHIVNVFKEAKAAYRERKAEIHCTRQAEHDEKQARLALKQLDLEEDDHVSRASSKRSDAPRRSKSSRHAEKPPFQRGYTDSFSVNDRPAGTASRPQPPPAYYNAQSPQSPRRVNTSPLAHDDFALAYGEDWERQELVRRHSDNTHLTSKPTARPRSLDDVDLDLAYGELPPPLPARRHDEEIELRAKVTRLQQLLDEANCLQHSATATIENLQKNPDALAAVGLALAEISNMATKMAPGVLTAMKGSFPAVFALLASPQFLIAAGVGVGVTVVMLGGYKIVKRLKERKELDRADRPPSGSEAAELQELLGSDLSHIERWRRGIADCEAESVGTTVDGEFITPVASRRLIAEGALRPEDLKSGGSTTTTATRKKKKKEKEKKESRAQRHGGGDGDGSSKRAKSSASDRDGKGASKKTTKKEPSGLKMLFKGHSA